MKSSSSLFWNKPPERDRSRSVDPLGFVSLREAMADTLVPLLTGATRDADDYIWTLIGLRWSREKTGSMIDKVIFNDRSYGFAVFERALKQYWYRTRGKISGLGIRVVEKLCEERKPDISRPILVDQRATGLLGNYIVSLRGMGLVDKTSLCIVDDMVGRVLVDVAFNSSRGWISDWKNLEETFNKTCKTHAFKTARRRIGQMLFSGNDKAMTNAASAVIGRPDAASWVNVDRRALSKEQDRLSVASKHVVRLERAALDAFKTILGGENISAAQEKSLRSLAGIVRKNDPFPPNWKPDNLLRKAMFNAVSALAAGRNSDEVILDLHLGVTQKIRQNEPWISHLGDKPVEYQDWSPSTGEPDYRFGNLKNLIKQTKWRPNAA